MAQGPFRIIIVGGGIAGLTTAIALRGPGREITVFEQSRQLCEIGAAISLQPNASKIMNHWGMGPLLDKYHGLRDEGFRVFNAQGSLAKEIAFDPNTYGADRVVFHRVDLLDALKEAALSRDRPGAPITLKLASRVVACGCEDGIVAIEDGTTYTGDLIIGADGIHSQLRRYVIGKDLDARPTGVSAYRLIVPTKAINGNPEVQKSSPIRASDTWTNMVMGYDRRIVMGPCRQGKLFSVVALVPDEHMHEKSDKSSWTSEGSLAHLLESFAVFPEWIKDIFRAAPSLGLWQLRDLDPLETWTKGRVILIGDAAHAMLPTMGQGASQSVEDAEAVQAYFGDVEAQPTAGDVAERLALIYRSRRQRAGLIQAYSRQQAGQATSKDGSTVVLDPVQFQDYSCRYEGAKQWAAVKVDED